MSKTAILESSQIKKALAMLDPAWGGPVIQAFHRSGWALTVIDAARNLDYQSPEGTGCLLLDSACGPVIEELLAWCEKDPRWRGMAKVVIGKCNPGFHNLVAMPREAVSTSLIDTLARAQRIARAAQTEITGQRRSSFRLKCSTPSVLQVPAVLQDLSAGGVAIQTFGELPLGQRVQIKISDDDPLLHLVEAEVLDCKSLSVKDFRIHLRFVATTPAQDRALQRHMLSLQAKRMRTG